MGWLGSFHDKSQFKEIDDFVHNLVVCEESDDLHLSAALGAEHCGTVKGERSVFQRIWSMSTNYHCGPALGGDRSQLLPHPFAPFLQALGMAGEAEPPGATGEHQQVLFPTVGIADAGKPAAQIAAVKVAPHYLLDNGAEEAVLFLEAMLILREEAVEVMKKHPVEGSPLRMSGTINSGHSRSFSSRNRPARSKDALCSLCA